MKENKPRILFSTVPYSELITDNGPKGKYINHNDLSQNISHTSPKPLQLRSFIPASGMRFINTNIPEIDILEYPDWEELKNTLNKGYDIFGVSFLTYTFPVAIKMAKIAKEFGVKETWAGNYGIMTPDVEKYFDRLFIGTAEYKIADILGKNQIKELKHPEIIYTQTLPALKPLLNQKRGLIFTSRGCPMKCHFCPTPSFDPNLEYLTIQEIERIMDVYREKKVNHIHFTDETFLLDKKHSDQVINLAASKGLQWSFMTRADLVKGRVKEFKDKGMALVGIGVESLRDINLRKQNKGEAVDVVLEVLEEAEKNNLPIFGTYMLCFEDDTPESIREDIDRLSNMNILGLQFAIFTPFPNTPLWDCLKDKIIDHDWGNYDHMHLVWKHPHINQEEAEDLFNYAHKKVNKPSFRSFSNLIKIAFRRRMPNLTNPIKNPAINTHL